MTSTLQPNHAFENNFFSSSALHRSMNNKVYATDSTFSAPTFGNSIWQSNARDDPRISKSHVVSQGSSYSTKPLSVLPPTKSNQPFGTIQDKRSPTSIDGSSAFVAEPLSAHSRSNNDSSTLTPNSTSSSSDHFPPPTKGNNGGRVQQKPAVNSRAYQESVNAWSAAKEFRPTFYLSQHQSIDPGVLEPLKRPFQSNSHSIESIWTQPQYQNAFDPVVAQGGFQPVAPPKATSYIQANHESSKKDDRSNTTQSDMLRGFEGLRVSQPQHGHLPRSQQYTSYHVPLPTQSLPRDQKQFDQTYADTWSANQHGKGPRPHVNGPSAGGQVINRKSMAGNNAFNYMPVQHQQSVGNMSSSYGRQSRDLENGFDGYQVQELQHYQQQPYTQTYYPSNVNIPVEAHHGHYGYSGAMDTPGMALELANDGQNDTNHIYRSPLLEDFRINKAKKYELKDIYGHIVEFSGDQLGSRFIQQKLEVATSDEKDRVFNEIAQDSRQLMTDVFGNYVIQKMFEHGNQPQKKLLASHMKGHIYALSTQVYGCRVVQKALEYILTDQQASLIKELDGCVLKVVEDQNGNHVIQKAIERIPGEHIQFIIDAHRGHVHYLSKHSYGCRVIQRMLEHCTPRAKRQILVELHMNISDLIQDAFGNYVVQHVIANGEAQDRKPVIDKVVNRLLENATHKFASNVVEKALDYADDEQRRIMLRKLTVRDETGQSQSSKLLSHQYGNYVIQKSGAHLQGHTLASLIEEMEQYLLQLRRVSTGKQVTAFENTIREARHRLDRQRLENGIHSAPTQPRTSIARR